MNNRKKILLVCDKNECTSFGRLALSLAHALKEQFEAEILWLKTPKYFGNSTDCDNLEIWARSLHTGFFSYRTPFKKILKKENPDVVFFIRPELGFLVPVAKNACPGAKSVMFVHDTFAETLYPDSLKFKLLNRFFIRDTVKADFFVYNSRWTKGEAEAHFGIGCLWVRHETLAAENHTETTYVLHHVWCSNCNVEIKPTTLNFVKVFWTCICSTCIESFLCTFFLTEYENTLFCCELVWEHESITNSLVLLKLECYRKFNCFVELNVVKILYELASCWNIISLRWIILFQ